MTRVALITPGFSDSPTDWCIPAVRDLVAGLTRRVEVVVFAVRYPYRSARYEVFGADVHAVGGGQTRGLARLPLMVRALRAVVSEGRRRRFDVIHALWAHEPGFLAVIAGRILGAPVVVSLLGGELAALQDIDYGGQLTRVNRWLVRCAVAGRHPVTVGTRYLHQLAVRRVPEARLVRLPLGVDVERFSPAPEPEAGRQERLLRVAALTPVKAPLTLLDAFRHVAERVYDVHLDFVGDGPLRADLERRLREWNLEDRVTLQGSVEHDRLPACYRRAQLYVQSSEFESQGMTVLEAAACGVPTVGTAVGVLPELVDSACVVAPGDPTGLAKVILGALDDPARCAAMGRRAKAVVREAWTVEHGVEALDTLYRTLGGSGAAVG